MKTLILGSVAAAALALSIGASAAQSQHDGDAAVSLSFQGCRTCAFSAERLGNYSP
jgi:hypothetical protein